MKARNRVEYAITGVLGALVLLTLVMPQLIRDRKPVQPLPLSVLLRDSDGSTAVRQGMDQAADELGAELRYLTPAVPGDPASQEELLLRELEGGAKAFVVVPADPGSLYETLLRLEEPCPVVTLACAMAGGAGSVAPDNAQVGRSLAGALLEDWTGGEVLLLDSPGCPEAAQRLEGAMETLRQAGVPARRSDTLCRTGWVMTFEEGATRQTAAAREARNLPFALYGTGSSTGVTVQLERGNIAAVAAWSDYAAGYLAVRQAVECARGARPVLDPLAFSIVRGEDIYAPENQKLLFPFTS